MKDWTVVYIGLGSNLGDREGYLARALEKMAGDPGIELLQTSDIRETRPLGRQDQRHYLNAVVQARTTLTGPGLHERLAAIEVSLGRRRAEAWGSRTIDLDLLLYGDQIITKSHLTVPHRQMHMRSFVLASLNQLASELIHPLLRLSIKELSDRLQGCDFVLDPQRPQLISVAGNIGVGKTTLVRRLVERLDGKSLLEPYESNPFMPEVYAGRQAFALDSQLHFLVHRTEQLERDRLRRGRLYLSDYLYDQEQVYANHLLDPRQLTLYQHIYVGLSRQVASPCLLLYLRDAPECCLRRIRQRNRPYEQGIELSFLETLNRDYDRLIGGWSASPVIRLDAAEFDCLNERHLERLIEQIRYYVCITQDQDVSVVAQDGPDRPE